MPEFDKSGSLKFTINKFDKKIFKLLKKFGLIKEWI